MYTPEVVLLKLKSPLQFKINPGQAAKIQQPGLPVEKFNPLEQHEREPQAIPGKSAFGVNGNMFKINV